MLATILEMSTIQYDTNVSHLRMLFKPERLAWQRLCWNGTAF